MMEIKEVKDVHSAEKVARLADIVWREHYDGILAADQIDYMLDKFQSASAVQEQISNGTSYYLVRDDGMGVGYFAIEPQQGLMFISKLYLIKAARGIGYGRSCVRFIEEQAAQRKLGIMRLTVNRKNSTSVAVYKKLGFSIVGEGSVDIGGGFSMDDYYMEKAVKLK